MSLPKTQLRNIGPPYARGKFLLIAALGGFALALTGCTDDSTIGTGPSVHLNVVGHDVELEMDGCQVNKVDQNWFGHKHRSHVLSATGFYPGFTVCSRFSLLKQGDFAIVDLCRQAFGAGGGCVKGGTYRTRDGVTWEQLTREKTWAPLER